MNKKSEIIKGIHPVMEAIIAGHDLRRVFIQKGLKTDNSRKLLNLITKYNIPFQSVPKEKLNRISSSNHQGVIAMKSPIEFQKIEWLIPYLYEKGEIPLIVILDNITDVRNFGAIVRSAECMGVNGIVIPFKGAADVNEDAVKTSAGAMLKMNICRENELKNTIIFLKQSGIQIISATEKSSKTLDTVDFSIPTAIILGSESRGISKGLLKYSDLDVEIPMTGTIGSLNVSVSAGIFFYEAAKQRLK